MSERSDTIDRVSKFLDHELEHVVSFPVIIKKFDKDCNTCRILFDRIDKKSQNPIPVSLGHERPVAIVYYTTILCATGMHEECGKEYVMPKVKIVSSCICDCHKQAEPIKKTKNRKQKRKRRT